ncbi:pPIWI_RE module domain-containing protein [Streptomyces sp. NPDC088727]|uniref:pPIWI_RE module domain-containing protein n=1 Tax=Streptomyces sp. NPDC088727 TaxID=3365875 RepID=UPI0037F297AE
MSLRYDSVRTASWLPATPDASHIARYRALPFPEQWRDALLDLCSAGREKRWETVPTWRMDQVLQTFAPDLLVRPRPSQYRGEGPDFWLYAPHSSADPLPDPAFQGLLGAWLHDLRPEPEHRSRVAEVRALFREEPPQWQQDVEVDLLKCPTTAGKTAAPDSRQFQLTTDWLARRILSLEPYDFGAGRLRFRAMPRGPQDQGAELVSQALPHEGARGTEWYSVVLNITLHTVPFEPLPRFHFHTHIRRYATRIGAKTGRLHLPFGRRTTVMLRPRVPWLPGAPLSDRFAVARLAWLQGGYDWVGGGPAGMLRNISLTAPFPDAQALLAAPAEWIQDDMRAAVVYSTAMGSHEVGAGLMSHQRSALTEWAEEALPEELRPTAPLVRTRLAGSTPANPRQDPSGAAKKAEANLRRAEARRKGAAFALGDLSSEVDVGVTPVLEARLLWQTPTMRDTAVAALIAHLDLKGDGGAPDTSSAYETSPVVLEWQMPELVVRLRCLKLPRSLGGDLLLPEGSRHSREAVTTALAVRRTQTSEFVASDQASPVPTLALVEIDRAKDFASPAHDPKFALRLGCADAKVLTQFMAVPKKTKGYNSEKNAEFRAAKAWDDGLRQLGVRVHPEHNLGEQLPQGLRYLATWMVRKNARSRTRWASHVPVAVLVTPQPSVEGAARVQGWDEQARAWVPYPVMLLQLTRRAEIPRHAVPAPRDTGKPASLPSWWADRAQQRRNAEEWLEKVLRSVRGTPTVLLAHGQNMRSHWTWLQDGNVVADKFRGGHAPARRLDPDLRIVRVRSARGRETAQWWGLNPDPNSANGLPAHLWTDPSATLGETRVFWSTTPKAQTFKLSVAADKLAPRVNTKGKLTIDTGEAAWNPGLVEVSVLGCHPQDGDVPEALALAVHQLRQAPDLPDALSLPLPLHLAGLSQEYVLPTRAEEDSAPETDQAADANPDVAAAPGLAHMPEPAEHDEQLSLFEPSAGAPAA